MGTHDHENGESYDPAETYATKEPKARFDLDLDECFDNTLKDSATGCFVAVFLAIVIWCAALVVIYYVFIENHP